MSRRGDETDSIAVQVVPDKVRFPLSEGRVLNNDQDRADSRNPIALLGGPTLLVRADDDDDAQETHRNNPFPS